ncbi:MAG: hypothetical protein ACK6A4_16795 [Alphaproteobacteria bacterium]
MSHLYPARGTRILREQACPASHTPHLASSVPTSGLRCKSPIQLPAEPVTIEKRATSPWVAWARAARCALSQAAAAVNPRTHALRKRNGWISHYSAVSR